MRTLLIAGLACLCLMAGNSQADAEPVRLSVGTILPRADLIQPGVRHYLRYSVRDGKRETIDIWVRELTFEQVDGRDVMRITQRWDRVVPPASVRLVDSVFEPLTFRPLTHVSRAEIDGQVRLSGYQFEPDRVTGLSGLEGNSKADFEQASPEPAFNFVTDLEQFQGLAWGPGYEVSIPFYDPGLAPPNRYVFRTDGSDVLSGPGGIRIDCWRVTADYNTGAVVKTFWFAKADNAMIREESRREGIVYVKTLLWSESGDQAPTT
ncbi:MAG: DUF3108 domain-containing protein [Brevundimonas sp.]